MKSPAWILTFLLLVTAVRGQVPDAFKGLFEADIPVRGQIGVVMPPPEIDEFVAKFESAARQDSAWFREYSAAAKPGAPLPYHEKLGLSREEYDQYIALWNKREFKPVEEVVLLLRKGAGGTWSITATGAATPLTTLRHDPATDIFRSPNGELVRIEDIKADASSILGEWSGREWKFEEETGLGRIKENIALGKLAGEKFGLVVYRVQELSSEGTRLLDKSLVVRFALGKAGQIKPPAAAPAPKR